ncbi:MAG: glycosyltransferase family 2 protein [Anaerolineae bacterium]|nr:glycosyltransferase family 2 protein [Anaerolineae bacterium]
MIMPALNEARRLPNSLIKVDEFLKQQSYTAELIVVENGSTDTTVQVVEDFAKTHPYVRLFKGEPRGKGRAVRRGMIEARGDYRFMCDVDLSMPIEEISKFLPPTLNGVDVAIGSREVKGAVRYNEPTYRHLMGRISNLMIKLLVLPGFEDTQCGFKMLSAEAAKDIFSVGRMNGIGFDIELMYIAVKRGYKVAEIPIHWYYDADTKMRAVQDSFVIFREMLEIRRNWSAGLYKKRT